MKQFTFNLSLNKSTHIYIHIHTYVHTYIPIHLYSAFACNKSFVPTNNNTKENRSYYLKTITSNSPYLTIRITIDITNMTYFVIIIRTLHLQDYLIIHWF